MKSVEMRSDEMSDMNAPLGLLLHEIYFNM